MKALLHTSEMLKEANTRERAIQGAKIGLVLGGIRGAVRARRAGRSMIIGGLKDGAKGGAVGAAAGAVVGTAERLATSPPKVPIRDTPERLATAPPKMPIRDTPTREVPKQEDTPNVESLAEERKRKSMERWEQQQARIRELREKRERERGGQDKVASDVRWW
jgi:hypothetical protein